MRARIPWPTNEELSKAGSAVRKSRTIQRGLHDPRRRVKQPGSLNPDRVFRDLHGPDGEVIAQGIGDDATTQIETAAEKRFPHPIIDSLPASTENIVKDQIILHAARKPSLLGPQWAPPDLCCRDYRSARL